MPDPRETARQRALLTITHTQFASEVQSLKQASLDRMVTNILYTAASGVWTRVPQIREAFRQDSGGYAPNDVDIELSLRRLQDRRKVERHSGPTYRLSNRARREVRRVHDEAERLFDTVLERLFASDHRGYRRYGPCFLDILSAIFGQLGEESVRLIGNINNGEEVVTPASLTQALANIRSRQSELDHDLIRSAVESFFRDDDPRYNEIKWNLAQSIFVAKALGFDPTGSLLSRELFQGAIFYLDTNGVTPVWWTPSN